MTAKNEALALADAEYKARRAHLENLAKIDADIAALHEQIEKRNDEKREAYRAALDGGWKADDLKRFNIAPAPRRRPRKAEQQTTESNEERVESNSHGM